MVPCQETYYYRSGRSFSEAQIDGVGSLTPQMQYALKCERNRMMLSMTAGEPSASLKKFWSYVVAGKVDENIVRFTRLASGADMKKISFQGHQDDTRECPKWGPSFAFSQLVERAEYVRCWDDIRKKADLKFVLLRGSKGIGKSVFIYWLIYKLVREALCAGSAIPSILLITQGDTHKKYELLTVENNTPVVRMTDGLTRADYTLSDFEYDMQVNTTFWNLNVVSYGTKSEPKLFNDAVEDVGALGLKLLMSPFQLEEIQAMLGGPVCKPYANFSYAVFGGSARMAKLLNMNITAADTGLCAVVEAELRRYFSGSEQCKHRNDLIVQAARVIAYTVSNMQALSDTEEWQVAALRHSLFEHRYFEVTSDGLWSDEGQIRLEVHVIACRDAGAARGGGGARSASRGPFYAVAK